MFSYRLTTDRPPFLSRNFAAVSRCRLESHVEPYLQLSGRPRSARQRAQDAFTAADIAALPSALVGPVDFDPCKRQRPDGCSRLFSRSRHVSTHVRAPSEGVKRKQSPLSRISRLTPEAPLSPLDPHLVCALPLGLGDPRAVKGKYARATIDRRQPRLAAQGRLSRRNPDPVVARWAQASTTMRIYLQRRLALG